MAYFNYFIKCLIRRLVYLICKPKVAFTILLSTAVFFGMKYYGLATWSDSDVEYALNSLTSMVNDLTQQVAYLNSINVNVSDCETQLANIKNLLSSIESDTSNITFQLTIITNSISNLNSSIMNIYNKLEENQQELISKLEEENQKILDELSLLRDSLQGSEASPVSAVKKGIYDLTINGEFLRGISAIYIPMEYGYTYTIKLNYTSTSSVGQGIMYCFYDKLVTSSSTNISVPLKFAGGIAPNTTTTITITTRDYKNQYLYLFWDMFLTDFTVTASIEGIVDVTDRVDQSINDMNNSINNSDVNVDSSLPTNDTNDITENGFNSIFNTLYNAFTQKNSQDIVLSIPFTNKSFVINYNTVFGNFTFGIVGDIINAFWYFVICIYIVKDIENKIYKIKSGNIEDIETGNIKGDLL